MSDPNKKQKGVGIKTRRTIAYVVLILSLIHI